MSAPRVNHCLGCERPLGILPLVLSQTEAAALRRVLNVAVSKGDAFCNQECALIGIYAAFLQRLKGES